MSTSLIDNSLSTSLLEDDDEAVDVPEGVVQRGRRHAEDVWLPLVDDDTPLLDVFQNGVEQAGVQQDAQLGTPFRRVGRGDDLVRRCLVTVAQEALLKVSGET